MGPAPTLRKTSLDPAQGREHRQSEYVVRPAEGPGQVVANDSRPRDHEHILAAQSAQALDPVNRLERNPHESDPEESREAGPARERDGRLRGAPVDCFGRKSRDLVARADILRIGAETKQSPIGPASPHLVDDRL